MDTSEDMNKFNGTFTPYFRELLKKRRHAQHQSYADVAKLVGVSCSAVRKWEYGLAIKCHAYNVSKIRAYLCGRLERIYADDMKLLFAKKEWEDFIAKYTARLQQDSSIKKYHALIQRIGGMQSMREIVGLCFYAITYLAYRKLHLYDESEVMVQQNSPHGFISGDNAMVEVSNAPEQNQESEGKFAGVFTHCFCELIKKRRQQFDLSYSDIGKILGVRWNTVRNWEIGKIKKCHASHVIQLRHFLHDGLALEMPSKSNFFLSSGIKRVKGKLVISITKQHNAKGEIPNCLTQLGDEFSVDTIELTADIVHTIMQYQQQIDQIAQEDLVRKKHFPDSVELNLLHCNRS